MVSYGMNSPIAPVCSTQVWVSPAGALGQSNETLKMAGTFGSRGRSGRHDRRDRDSRDLTASDALHGMLQAGGPPAPVGRADLFSRRQPLPLPAPVLMAAGAMS